jgi:hypothetical protein
MKVIYATANLMYSSRLTNNSARWNIKCHLENECAGRDKLVHDRLRACISFAWQKSSNNANHMDENGVASFWASVFRNQRQDVLDLSLFALSLDLLVRVIITSPHHFYSFLISHY